MSVMTITKENYQKEIAESEETVLLDFGPAGAAPAAWYPRWWMRSRKRPRPSVWARSMWMNSLSSQETSAFPVFQRSW